MKKLKIKKLKDLSVTDLTIITADLLEKIFPADRTTVRFEEYNVKSARLFIHVYDKNGDMRDVFYFDVRQDRLAKAAYERMCALKTHNKKSAVKKKASAKKQVKTPKKTARKK